VPSDLWAWVREDLARTGAWEYQVLERRPKEAARLQAELNALGRERWDCVSVSPVGEGMVLVLKRPAKSYLGQLNLRDVLRVLPDRN
jgi:hypothetical protein